MKELNDYIFWSVLPTYSDVTTNHLWMLLFINKLLIKPWLFVIHKHQWFFFSGSTFGWWTNRDGFNKHSKVGIHDFIKRNWKLTTRKTYKFSIAFRSNFTLDFSFGCRGVWFLHHCVVRKCHTCAVYWWDGRGSNRLWVLGHDAHTQLSRARRGCTCTSVPRWHQAHSGGQTS